MRIKLFKVKSACRRRHDTKDMTTKDWMGRYPIEFYYRDVG